MNDANLVQKNLKMIYEFELDDLCNMAYTMKDASPEQQLAILKKEPNWIEYIAEEQLHPSIRFILL